MDNQHNTSDCLKRYAELETQMKTLENLNRENVRRINELKEDIKTLQERNIYLEKLFRHTFNLQNIENKNISEIFENSTSTSKSTCESQPSNKISINQQQHIDSSFSSLKNSNDKSKSDQNAVTEKQPNQKEETYKKRAGTLDHGKEYEYLMCAYLAIKSCNDSDIIDFSMTTNNAEYGDFDDISLTVDYVDKTSHTFLVQLKHTESDKRRLTDKMLASDKGDFSLLKYVESFRKLKNQKNISCILSTNKKAQIQNNSKISVDFGKIVPNTEGIVYASAQCQANSAKYSLLDTSRNEKSCFQFELETKQGYTDDISEFFQCFYLLTNQNNHVKIRSQIDGMLNEMFGCKIEFINFMQQWWKCNFVLTKHYVIVKLSELALTPFIQAIHETVDKSLMEKSKPLKNAIQKFEMTLVKNDYKDTIGKIWTEIAVEKQNIIKFSLKYGLSEVGTDQLPTLEHSKVLWFLSKVPLIVKYDEQEDKRIRGAIQLLEKEATKMRIIMLTSKTKNEFPGWQIFETLYDLQNEETYCYTEIIEKFKVSLQGRPTISLKQLIDSNMTIAKAIETEQLLQMMKENFCIGKSFQKLPEVYIPRTVLNMSSSKTEQNNNMTVKEDQLYSVFNKPLNMVTGQAGIGKSTLLIYLSQQCPSDCCCVLVKLIEHSTFLRKRPSTKEILNEFLKSEDTFLEKIKTELQQNGKLYLLLDGLDEISSDTVDTVLDFIEESYSSGIKIWVTSRENLEAAIIKRLKIFSLHIEEVTAEEQRTYIHARLSNNYVEKQIEEIINAVFQSINISNNVKNILAVPLQLYIITEIFLGDEGTYEKLVRNEDIFVLSKMYRNFFQGKQKHQEEKAKVQFREAFNDYFDYQLKLYEMLALRTCLDSDIFNKLKLENSREFNECEKLLRCFKINGDKLGIISQVVEENQTLKAIFSHRSFAEYFACVWLKNNVEKLRLLKFDFFNVKYENLRLIFDIMLSEDRPLHLATLYKNPEQVEKYIQLFEEKDIEGRSALHLICSYGIKFKYSYLHPKRDTIAYIRIFQMLSSICEPLEHDALFEWTCLDYASTCMCLYPFEKCCIQLEVVVRSFDQDKLAFFCAYCGYSNILKALIEKDGNIIDVETSGHQSLLIIAVNAYLDTDESELKQMNIEAMKILIKYDINVNYSHCATNHFNESTDSALHIALTSEKTDKDLIEFLIDNKANINMENSSGSTPFLEACGNPDNSILELFIRKGASVNSENKSGYGPLHEACTKGIYCNVMTLLKAGANIKAVTKSGRTLLHYAGVCSNSNVDVVNLLVHNTLDINATDQEGNTPLSLACLFGTHEIVETLVENGANIHFVTKSEKTLLHCALLNNKSDQGIIRFLIQRGVKPENIDNFGLTALQMATKLHNYNAVEELIEKGANVNVTTKSNQTLLHLLMYSGRGHTVKEDTSTVKLLTEKGIDINAEDENGYTALHVSARTANYVLLKTLIEYGANINVLTKSNENALHVLVKHVNRSYFIVSPETHANQFKIIELLTRSGIDVSQVNQDGDTALQLAIREQINVDYIKALLENGYDIHVKTSQNETLLHLALKYYQPLPANTETVQLLLSTSEELVNTVNKSEESPLFLACRSRNPLLINFLLEKDIILDYKTRDYLVSHFSHFLMHGYVNLLRLLFKNISNLEELNIDDNVFPPKFPLHLAKRNDILKADLLLEMAQYLKEYFTDRFFIDDASLINIHISSRFQNSSSSSTSDQLQ